MAVVAVVVVEVDVPAEVVVVVVVDTGVVVVGYGMPIVCSSRPTPCIVTCPTYGLVAWSASWIIET